MGSGGFSMMKEPPSDPAERAAMAKSAHLSISFWRVRNDDTTGCFDMTCEGTEYWMYANIGPLHGMQGEAESEDPRVMEFGAKVYDLVRDYFKDMPATLEESRIRRRHRG